MIALFALIVFTGCNKTQPADTGSTSDETKSIQDEAKDIQKAFEVANAGIVVPENLEKCDLSKFIVNGQPKDCRDYGEKDKVCSYYLDVIKETGEQSNQNGEFDNECGACRYFGPKQILNAGKHEFRNLGFERKPCTQGMYSIK